MRRERRLAAHFLLRDEGALKDGYKWRTDGVGHCMGDKNELFHRGQQPRRWDETGEQTEERGSMLRKRRLAAHFLLRDDGALKDGMQMENRRSSGPAWAIYRGKLPRKRTLSKTAAASKMG
jgi:hypothetical protein